MYIGLPDGRALILIPSTGACTPGRKGELLYKEEGDAHGKF